MNKTETFASGILAGFTVGIASALITHYRDEKKFEPSLQEKAKELDAKWTKDGAVLAEQLASAKHDAKMLAKENK